MFALGYSVFAVAVVALTIFSLRAQRRSLTQANVPKFSVALDAVGLTVTDLRLASPGYIHLAWSEICRIHAYKRDLFAYDCICLFISRADDTGMEIDEQMVGWSDFCKALPQHLPTCVPFENWYVTVAFPAFETNFTELYVRTAVHNT